MSSPGLEAFLARLYAEEPFLEAFLHSPEAAAQAAGLDDAETAALAVVDRDALVMAAASYRAKRRERRRHPPLARAWRRLTGARPWR